MPSETINIFVVSLEDESNSLLVEAFFEVHYLCLFQDMATIIAEKCVNPETKVNFFYIFFSLCKWCHFVMICNCSEAVSSLHDRESHEGVPPGGQTQQEFKTASS
jgi:hypothetical protein